MWQCGFALVQGRKLASVEVTHFHERLNAQQYEDICRNADDGFKAKQSQEELIKFLAAVHKKLGKAGVEKQVNIRVDTNTNGTFLTTWYNTEFASGTATETFTWRKSNGSWRLLGYNVQSAALPELAETPQRHFPDCGGNIRTRSFRRVQNGELPFQLLATRYCFSQAHKSERANRDRTSCGADTPVRGFLRTRPCPPLVS
jgi:hypothetical protein